MKHGRALTKTDNTQAVILTVTKKFAQKSQISDARYVNNQSLKTIKNFTNLSTYILIHFFINLL